MSARRRPAGVVVVVPARVDFDLPPDWSPGWNDEPPMTAGPGGPDMAPDQTGRLLTVAIPSRRPAPAAPGRLRQGRPAVAARRRAAAQRRQRRDGDRRGARRDHRRAHGQLTGFAYDDQRLHADAVPLADLAQRFGTPLYVYSAGDIRRRYRLLADAFAGTGTLLCYALKANPTLGVVATLAAAGAGADVVSGASWSGHLPPAFRPSASPSPASASATRRSIAPSPSASSSSTWNRSKS